jgi:flavin-dependent dehydrogenase
MSNTYDAIVIGGGPGGSTVSTLLADAGRKVLLLEREQFPRYHIGESLLSGTADILKKIGVLEKVENSGFIKKHGVTWIWGNSREPWTVYFKDALAMPYDYGYQVERGPFDKLLLDNAREHDVNVLERHRVTDLKWDKDRIVGVEYESIESGVRQTAEAAWIVDASGQGGFITKQLGDRKWDEKLRNMAIWSYWKDAWHPEGLDAGNTFLPTFDDGWWWYIPLREDITSIGAVLDQENYALALKQGVKEFYLAAIERTPELAKRLHSAQMVDEIRVMKDWSYVYDSFFGKGYIAVGDAACFIDPLFSTGVHLAMLSGFLAAVCLNTILTDPSQNESEILNFYQEQYYREYKRLKEQVYFLYGGHNSKESYFWHARNTLDIPNARPEEAFITLIAGAYEHRSWYRRYMNNLEMPTHLRKITDGIFNGETAGFNMVSLNSPLVKSQDWEFRESFAIDSLRLRPTKVIAFADGRSLPLTENMSKILSKVDGQTNSLGLIELCGDGDEKAKEFIRSTLNEAITHGVLIAEEA